MKVLKIIGIIGTVVLIIVALRFNWIKLLSVQFSQEKYFDMVAGINYEKELKEAPVCIMDRAYKNNELSPTDSESIMKRSEMHDEIEEKYRLSEIASADTDFERTLQILDWLTEHTYYSGAQLRGVTDNTVDILEFSFDKPFTHAINCRNKAIAFADCLVAVGIKAYPVCMISADFTDNHFTCMAYMSEIDKWCAFDPSFGCWFSDENGSPVGFYEIREMFLEGHEPVVNGYNFNGTEKSFDVYMNGFLKHNISNLSTWNDNSMENRDTENRYKRKAFVSEIPAEVR